MIRSLAIALAFTASAGFSADKDYRAFVSTGLNLYPYEYNISLGTRYSPSTSFGYSLTYAENTETISIPSYNQGTINQNRKQKLDFNSNTNALFFKHYFYGAFFSRHAIERREWHKKIREHSEYLSGDIGGGYEFDVNFDVVSTRYTVALGYDFIFKQRYVLGLTALSYVMPEAGHKKSVTIEKSNSYGDMYAPQADINHSNLEVAKTMAKRAELIGPQISFAFFF